MTEIEADSLLGPAALAEPLTVRGFRTSPATLATKRTRGGGPPFRKFGASVLYRWGDAIEWVERRLSAPRRSTSESDSRRTAA
jgi:hypothetical protein